MKLPELIDFDETAFPELLEIFAEIDSAIVAMLAADPGLQLRANISRRGRKPVSRTRAAGQSRRPARRAAA